MSITDELRKWVKSLYTPNSDQLKLDAYRIADRIDATYEEDVNTACKLANSLSADELKEHGWVRLPLDADGVPIRVGDRVQFLGNDPSTVSHMSLASDGWRVYVKYDGDLGTGSGEPNRMRHYTPPTVEDVLRDFAYELSKRQNAPETFDPSELYAEYAAKLRLKEDA